MYVVPPPKSDPVVINVYSYETGFCFSFNGMQDAVNHIRWIALYASYRTDPWNPFRPPYYMKDDTGQLVTHQDVLDSYEFELYVQKIRFPNNLPKWHSGSKRNRGRYYRKPRVMNERRQEPVRNEYEDTPKVRAKRKGRRLPDPWDDCPIFYQRSWKKHRKNQYK